MPISSVLIIYHAKVSGVLVMPSLSIFCWFCDATHFQHFHVRRRNLNPTFTYMFTMYTWNPWIRILFHHLMWLCLHLQWKLISINISTHLSTWRLFSKLYKYKNETIQKNAKNLMASIIINNSFHISYCKWKYIIHKKIYKIVLFYKCINGWNGIYSIKFLW